MKHEFENLVGRIEFGPFTSMSELRRFAVTAPVESAQAIANLRDRLEEALSHLRAVVEAYDRADEHIRQKLQPEFERLGEDRLATWWHGIYDDVDHARGFLRILESRA